MQQISKSELRRRVGCVLSMVLGPDRVDVQGDRVTVDGIELEDVLAARHGIVGTWHHMRVCVHGSTIQVGDLDVAEIVDGRIEVEFGAFDDDAHMLGFVVGSLGGDESHPMWWTNVQERAQ